MAAFAPFAIGLLGLAGPAVLFALCAQASPGRAFRLGWVYGAGLMGFGVFWLRVSIAQFGGVSLPLAVAITLLFSGVMALYYGFAAWLGVRLARPHRPAVLALTLPAAWVLAEWLRGWLLTGFPWLALGYSQLELPSRGLAPLLGVYGVSLLVVFSAGCLLLWRRRWPPLLALGLWLAAAGAAALDWGRPAGEPFRVGIVQGNIEQKLKWRPERRLATLETYLRLTAQAADSRLIVWPETA
ncbi:MAG: apolipoprotein N-acyltransferase, partial [Gammaproteobacteria bacterium]